MKTEILNNNPDVPILLTRSGLRRLGITVSNSTLLRWEKLERFPRRIRMGGSSVAWLKSEVDKWLADCSSERANTIYADPFDY